MSYPATPLYERSGVIHASSQCMVNKALRPGMRSVGYHNPLSLTLIDDVAKMCVSETCAGEWSGGHLDTAVKLRDLTVADVGRAVARMAVTGAHYTNSDAALLGARWAVEKSNAKLAALGVDPVDLPAIDHTAMLHARLEQVAAAAGEPTPTLADLSSQNLKGLHASRTYRQVEALGERAQVSVKFAGNWAGRARELQRITSLAGREAGWIVAKVGRGALLTLHGVHPYRRHADMGLADALALLSLLPSRTSWRGDRAPVTSISVEPDGPVGHVIASLGAELDATTKSPSRGDLLTDNEANRLLWATATAVLA